MGHLGRDRRLHELAALLSARIDELRSDPPQYDPEHALHRTLDCLPIPAWVMDAKGIVRFVNRQWSDLTGTDVTNWRQAIHADDWPALHAARTPAIAEGVPYEVVLRVAALPGHCCCGNYAVAVKVAPVMECGQVAYWIGTASRLPSESQALRVA